MSLRQRKRRTLTLLACIPSTWQLIKDRATDVSLLKSGHPGRDVPGRATGLGLGRRAGQHA